MPFTKGIGAPELIIILVIVMIVFGVGRLPEVGGAMGRAIREFRKSQSDSAGEALDQDESATTDHVGPTGGSDQSRTH